MWSLQVYEIEWTKFCYTQIYYLFKEFHIHMSIDGVMLLYKPWFEWLSYLSD